MAASGEHRNKRPERGAEKPTSPTSEELCPAPATQPADWSILIHTTMRFLSRYTLNPVYGTTRKGSARTKSPKRGQLWRAMRTLGGQQLKPQWRAARAHINKFASAADGRLPRWAPDCAKSLIDWPIGTATGALALAFHGTQSRTVPPGQIGWLRTSPFAAPTTHHTC